VFDLFDPGARARLGTVLDAAARPGELALGAFSANRRRVLTAATVTAAPGWRLVVSSDLDGLPAARSLAIAAVTTAALVLIGGILLLLGTRRARGIDAVVDSLEEERDAARHLARELSEAALRLREAASALGVRTGSLAAEVSSARTGSSRTLEAIAEAEARSAELRSGVAARLPLLSDLASGVREVLGRSREARSVAATSSVGASSVGAAAGAAAAAEEEINVILTTGSAVTLALDNAGKGASAVAEAAERARLAALNAALESSRPGTRRQGAAQAADEMRKIAEEAAAGTRSLITALEEARAGMRGVSRAALEAGRRSHEAAAGAVGAAGAAGAAGGGEPAAPLRGLDEALRGLEDLLAKLDAAAISAEALQGEAASSDRSRSAAVGMARIMERMEALCGEISALASTVSRESSKAAARAAGTSG